MCSLDRLQPRSLFKQKHKKLMQQISVQLNSDTGEPRCDTDDGTRVREIYPSVPKVNHAVPKERQTHTHGGSWTRIWSTAFLDQMEQMNRSDGHLWRFYDHLQLTRSLFSSVSFEPWCHFQTLSGNWTILHLYQCVKKKKKLFGRLTARGVNFRLLQDLHFSQQQVSNIVSVIIRYDVSGYHPICNGYHSVCDDNTVSMTIW